MTNNNPFESAPTDNDADVWSLPEVKREPPKNENGEVDYSLPDGDYEVKLLEMNKGLSRREKPQATLIFGIANNEKYKNRKIYEYLSLERGDVGYYILRERLVALGATKDENGEVVAKPSQVVGNTAIATLKAEKDNRGIISSRIKKLTPA